MVKPIARFVAVALLGLSLASCGKKDSSGNDAASSAWYLQTPADTTAGYMRIDTTLHAFAADCQNNHTIRIYYPPTFTDWSSAKSYHVVSSRPQAQLADDEVCIEMTTSATNTWLSTGTDSATFFYQGGIYPYGAYINGVKVQHYTSGPLTDITTLTGNFNIYPDDKLPH